MIKCSKCGYEGIYEGISCPECNEKIVLTPEQIEEKIAEIERAEAAREYELAAEGHHILADMGRLDSQKEYANMLERGNIVSRDLDEAMKYYGMAAEKNDGHSAFKYSKLAERHNEKVSMFWLMFSAVLGCIEAYPILAEKLAKIGDNELANYYYALSAAYDDADSIVTLAKRYYTGTGIEQSSAYAKWYMDKLAIPPFHAIKMAYKLRSVRAEDPGAPRHPDPDRMLHRLALRAEEYGFAAAYHYINMLLAERGDLEAKVKLAMMCADGIGCERDNEAAMSYLKSAADDGHPDAWKYMGDVYLVGEIVERSVEKALSCYREAAGLGLTDAYELMGDIFCDEKLLEPNIAAAIELYDIGAKEGHASAKEKSEKLKDARESLYKRGIFSEPISPDEAFRCYAISASMGYTPANIQMAKCFKHGIGTKKNREQAFLWAERAAEDKTAESLLEYGLCFSRGIGTAFNFKKATEVLFRAARLGSADAKDELDRLLNAKRDHMVDAMYSKAMRLIYMKKLDEALELLEACIPLRHAKGIYALGCLHEFSIGVRGNRDRAYELYEMAYSLKFRDPRADYKLRILQMTRKYRR